MARPLGQWLRERREELHLSLSQVHLRTGGAVSTSTLSKVERGERPVNPELLLALAPVYKVDVQDLYRLAGYLPEGDQPAPEPEPMRPANWKDIEEMVRLLPDLSPESKRYLLAQWRADYDRMKQAAAERRRRVRKASG